MKDRIITTIAPKPKPITWDDMKKTALRVAAYARVSTDQEGQQSSLKAQTDYYKRVIEDRPNWKYVCVYADNGISGLGTKSRDGFNRMMEDCLAGYVEIKLPKIIL